MPARLTEGLYCLRHDGEGWVLLSQGGATDLRAGEIGEHAVAAARRWAWDVVIAGVDWTPVGMGDEATCYAVQLRPDVGLAAEPVGGLYHDGAGWAFVDRLGRLTDRNDKIGEADTVAAYEWARRINTARRRSRRRRWRVKIGVVSDGSYYDYHGVLGHQRLRRIWNQLLDRLEALRRIVRPRPSRLEWWRKYVTATPEEIDRRRVEDWRRE